MTSTESGVVALDHGHVGQTGDLGQNRAVGNDEHHAVVTAPAVLLATSE